MRWKPKSFAREGEKDDLNSRTWSVVICWGKEQKGSAGTAKEVWESINN